MTSTAGRPAFLKSQLRLLLCAVLMVSLVAGGGQLSQPQAAKASVVLPPVQVGTSFSPRAAAYLGLDYRQAFGDLLDMHFKVIRLPAYWNEIDDLGYGQLDWLMAAAAAAGQPVVLTVGMKSLGWPEFYLPDTLAPAPGAKDGADISDDPTLRSATRAFIDDLVIRYRGNPALVAWQVENEPFNTAGPQRWWLSPDFVREEVAVVKQLDTRPVIVTAFSHFNRGLDTVSSRHGFDLRQLLGFDVDTAEKDALAALQAGDILGMDVYTRIGYTGFLGRYSVSTAADNWDDHVAQTRRLAASEGKRAWVTEAQAEPWEPDKAGYMAPRSFGPEDIGKTFRALKDAGYSTVLLWGSEYWLWQAQRNGDPRWLGAVQAILAAEAKAPALSA